MAGGPGKEEGKFDFTSEGEAIAYISLDQARILAIEYARDHIDFYGPDYEGVNFVWEFISAEDSEDYYEIRLSFRPSGRFHGDPGLEQFIFDKTGELRIRQMLDEPREIEPPTGSADSATSKPSPVNTPPAGPRVQSYQPGSTNRPPSQEVLRRVNRVRPSVGQNVVGGANQVRQDTGFVGSRGWLIDGGVNIVNRLLRRGKWTRLGKNEALANPNPPLTQARE